MLPHHVSRHYYMHDGDIYAFETDDKMYKCGAKRGILSINRCYGRSRTFSTA
jgi:hypothetical protein